MGRTIRCHLLEPAPVARVSLRRYCPSDGEACSVNPMGYHSVSVDVEVPLVWIEDGKRIAGRGMVLTEEWRADSRWPKACPCGRAFLVSDRWQRTVNQLWRRADTGALVDLDDAIKGNPHPDFWGAMYHAWWHDRSWPGPDGRCVAVITPAGEWVIDAPSSNGGTPWRRTGELPDVTATPSIHFPGRYHAHLRDGVLSDC